MPAALFMAVARTLLRNLATVTRDPGEIFARCSNMLKSWKNKLLNAPKSLLTLSWQHLT